MKLPWYVPVLILAAGAGCSAPTPRTTLPSSARATADFIRVGVKDGNRITVRRVPLEEYVRAAIISEFAPASGDAAVVGRMFEVQAVIARTYALAHLNRHGADGFDVCATTHCQLFQPARLTTTRWAAQTADAVRQTAGAVLWFDDAPVMALFHADCGGRTSRADAVWGGAARPYLVSLPDDGPAAAAHAPWRYETTRSALLAALNKDPRTRVGGRLDSVEVLERDSTGRAERVALRGTDQRVVRGEPLREVLGRTFGARTVRSTWFHVRRTGATFIFEGRGFGHGVGLCQAGALARIRGGSKLADVLEHYYPGTKLVRRRSVRASDAGGKSGGMDAGSASSSTGYEVIAYTTTLTPNRVLSPR